MFEQLGVLLLFLAGTGASLAVWMWVLARLRAGKSVLMQAPRSESGLGGLDVLLLACLWLVTQIGCYSLADRLLPDEIAPTVQVDEQVAKELSAAHPIAKILVERPGPLTALLCILAAVVAAPIVEEFLFRGLFQGWLESAESRWRRNIPELALLPAGVLPIVASATLFACVHFRGAAPEVDLRNIYVSLIAASAGSMLLVAIAMAFFAARGISPRCAGWTRQHLGGDLALGFGTFAALLVPTYGLQLLLQSLPWQDHVTDPAPMYVFGLVAGYVWQRTGRLAPTIVAHACFNGLTLLGILFAPS